MSIAPAASPHPAAPVPGPVAGPVPAPPPRVRQQAREAATLMVFSAAASLGVATVFLLLAVAARQA